LRSIAFLAGSSGTGSVCLARNAKTATVSTAKRLALTNNHFFMFHFNFVRGCLGPLRIRLPRPRALVAAGSS
jgi:hypothetical protein